MVQREEIEPIVHAVIRDHRGVIEEWIAEAIENGSLTMNPGIPPEEFRRMQSDIEEIAAVVLGEPRTELEGGGRHGNGLVHAVEKISTDGVKLRIPNSVLALMGALGAAFITATGAIVASSIG